MYWNRLFSFIFAAIYLFVSIFTIENDGVMLYALGYLLIPLGFIWFGDKMGDFTGIGIKGIYNSYSTSGLFIIITGWILLLLPIAAALIIIVKGAGGGPGFQVGNM